jgi:hypothetical protein
MVGKHPTEPLGGLGRGLVWFMMVQDGTMWCVAKIGIVRHIMVHRDTSWRSTNHVL